MKTAFVSPSAAGLTHPSWLCAEPEREANELLIAGLAGTAGQSRVGQGKAGQGRAGGWGVLFGGKEARETPMPSSGGAFTVNTPIPTSF